MKNFIVDLEEKAEYFIKDPSLPPKVFATEFWNFVAEKVRPDHGMGKGHAIYRNWYDMVLTLEPQMYHKNFFIQPMYEFLEQNVHGFKDSLILTMEFHHSIYDALVSVGVQTYGS